jgi:hypothetical protein
LTASALLRYTSLLRRAARSMRGSTYSHPLGQRPSCT